MITQGYGSQNIEWIHMDHLGPEGVRIQLCILCKQYKVFYSSTWHHKSEMSSTNLPIDQIWSIWITDELKMFCFYSVSVFSSAEPQPLHVYLNSLSWLHRLSQPILLSQWGGGSLSHSLWFISPTCFTPTTLLGKTLPLRQICFPRVCIYVRLCDVFPQVCQHPNSRMREWGAEAVTALIKAGLAYKHDPPLAQNQVRRVVKKKNQLSVCGRSKT